MRTASQCMAMAARMEALAARDLVPQGHAEWTDMAACWRRLARQADWQDRYRAGPP